MKIRSIDDFKNTKIYLSSIEDRKVFQDICFSLGIVWWFHVGKSTPKYVLDHPFFVIGRSLSLGVAPEEDSDSIFNNKDNNMRQIFLHNVVDFYNSK